MTKMVDVMTRNVVSVRERAPYKEIVLVMRDRKFSALPVLDHHGNVIGVVSEDDLLVKEAYSAAGSARGLLVRHSDEAKAAALTAADLMTRPAITIGPDATVAEAARLMHAKHVKRLPVVDGKTGRLVGIVSRVDLLAVYDRPDADIRRQILEQVIESEFVLNRLAFEVTVTGGVVTLSGLVHREPVAVSLLSAVRQLDGVVAVRDRLSYPER
jgi:CBS domain-containing protein